MINFSCVELRWITVWSSVEGYITELNFELLSDVVCLFMICRCYMQSIVYQRKQCLCRPLCCYLLERYNNGSHSLQGTATSFPDLKWRPRLHHTVFISDWFHMGLAFCLHETVFMSYRTGLLFTRERSNPIRFVPFRRLQMKTLWKWHETDSISCKQLSPVSTQISGTEPHYHVCEPPIHLGCCAVAEYVVEAEPTVKAL